jgi:hypothetical protein
MRSPGSTVKEISSSSTSLPKDFLTPFREITCSLRDVNGSLQHCKAEQEGSQFLSWLKMQEFVIIPSSERRHNIDGYDGKS